VSTGLAAIVGRRLDPSSWLDVPQDRVHQFAAAIGGHQWIHVDPQRAVSGPFGGTVAHGYLTPLRCPWAAGSGRARWWAASARSTVACRVAVTLTFEIEAASKPVCVAAILIYYYA
jgi:acyl dehydratase